MVATSCIGESTAPFPHFSPASLQITDMRSVTYTAGSSRSWRETSFYRVLLFCTIRYFAETPRVIFLLQEGLQSIEPPSYVTQPRHARIVTLLLPQRAGKLNHLLENVTHIKVDLTHRNDKWGVFHVVLPSEYQTAPFLYHKWKYQFLMAVSMSDLNPSPQTKLRKEKVKCHQRNMLYFA